MVQRILFKDQGVIVERVLYFDLSSNRRQPEHIAVINAEKGSFVDADGAFMGKLVFEGEAWAWPKWAETITLQNGTGMLSIDRITNDGGLVAMKYIYAPGVTPSLSASPTMTIKENYHSATQQAYQQQVNALHQ